MRQKTITAALLACGLLTTGSVLAAPPSAEMLGFTCAACHGYDGVSNGPATPSIAGMPPEYFIETMKAFKNGERPATVMDRIAKGYSDEELEIMAEFFAATTHVPAKQTFDAAKASRGAKIHDRACEKCHSEGGRATEEDAGILAGQWIPYLTFAFEDFTSGIRPMDKKMASRVEKLSKEDIEALIHYYGSQQK